MNIQCISSFISTNRLSLVINCQINCQICPNWCVLFYLQQLKSRANTDQNFPTWTVGVTVHNFILILGRVRSGHSSGSGWVGQENWSKSRSNSEASDSYSTSGAVQIVYLLTHLHYVVKTLWNFSMHTVHGDQRNISINATNSTAQRKFSGIPSRVLWKHMQHIILEIMAAYS